MLDFFSNLDLQSLTFSSVLVRFALTLLTGGLLGVERSRKGRAAGFRTYILVCMGAASVMMTSQFIVEHLGLSADPTRLGAQVICGTGFLGAGTIIVTGPKRVQGLTTAAGLWASACMGLAIGIGFYAGALIMCVFMLVVMTILDWIETRYLTRSKYAHIFVEFENMRNIINFVEIAEKNHMFIENYEVKRLKSGTGIGVTFALRLKERKNTSAILETFLACEGLSYAEQQ